MATKNLSPVLDEIALRTKIFHENMGSWSTLLHPGLMFILMVFSFAGLFVTDSYGVAVFATIIGAGAFFLQVVGSVKHIRGA